MVFRIQKVHIPLLSAISRRRSDAGVAGKSEKAV
jgi:hypothetical protein